mmetsp:Transcript_3961/g.8746  ORF Transcript_3961/g.8746 Transcript_3961/m.8746 type:complete len:291 (-) Transcript_3961:214-1086(-)|eukprot:CAMPEP_0183737044 /NCGR_PEP_ID=MMETSP0737-20130205/50934_1 /TAXON_ID=385413 /ORGANISM="Thalassiosira miniscula, Strain CCMP1093" /LENGTH=290 /DNA_ID=CAMNT_0025971237 /DNA_START=46 /DNA_END=918 /DNA_ORIENTATION=+
MKHFFVTREVTGVFVWSLIACAFRICLSFLVGLASLRSSDEETNIWRQQRSNVVVPFAAPEIDGESCVAENQDGLLWNEVATVIAVLASWALAILPSKVNRLAAPGFIFGSTWILYPLRDRFGFIPNLPCRICETKMGRLSLRELAIILPIHFLVPAFAFWLIQLLLPTAIFASYAIDPVIYSEKNPWVVDLVRETFVNALFTVGLLVVPELLRINGIRRGYALLMLYPLYSFGVDAEGKASVFGPNLIYSLRCVSKHEEVPIAQWSHLLGPILGGVAGGEIMALFPDDK